MNDFIIYEHPLNEKVRTMLRLEHLFAQANHFLTDNSRWASRVMIETLIDIVDFLSRSDLKTELLKEIDRAVGSLRQLMENPKVDSKRLATILRALEHLSNNLHSISQPLGQQLRNDPFIAQIRQRCAIPGGSCDFDLPAYHYWLARGGEERLADQKRWLAQLDPAKQAIELILKMLRNSSEFNSATAIDGRFEKSLDSQYPYQLIRVALPTSSPYYAEMSGSKHIFSVRLLKFGGGQCEDDISIRYCSCIL